MKYRVHKNTQTRIVFIQEMHFRKGKVPKFKNRHFPTAYHCPLPFSKAKGVSIPIGHTVPLKLLSHQMDENGRYCIFWLRA